MGFDLNGFLGSVSQLQRWREHLASAVICELGGQLGLVPLTGRLFQELRARLGEEADRLDAAQGFHAYPSASHEEAACRWAREASMAGPVAYLSMGEFGNQSHEELTLWSMGEEVLTRVELRAVLDYLHARFGLDLGNRPVDLERYRGEDAAEKWAAAEASDRR